MLSRTVLALALAFVTGVLVYVLLGLDLAALKRALSAVIA